MLTRRDLLLSGALASRLRPAGPAGLDVPQSQSSGGGVPDAQDMHEIRDAIKALGQSLGPVPVPTEIADIRDRQHVHLRIYQKLPDYIDVGLRVWEHLYDWQLESHLPRKVARGADGHAEMEVMMTTLVLRPDVAEAQIGVPYDK